MSTNNPWLALSTYEEKDERSFFGREIDIDNLFSMIQQNEIVTCYAASGEGKSSLINAGLCPKLRRDNVFPIKIVFSSTDYNQTIINFDVIISKRINQSLIDYDQVLKDKAKEFGITPEGTFEFVDVITRKPSDETDKSKGLWWILRTQQILNPFNDSLLTPILVFDQFEEIFRAPWKAEFFKWLERLSSDVCPDEIATSLHDKTDGFPRRKLFKMLFSMRYEYVGELDYWCSYRCFIPQMMRNRYFLKPLRTQDAIFIIKSMANSDKNDSQEQTNGIAEESPSKKLCDKASVIVKYLKKTQKSKKPITVDDTDEVSAIALSLVCHVLYDRLENDKSFSLDDDDELEKIINNSIYDYYEDQLDAINVPQHVRETIEEVLSPNNDRPRIPVTFPRLKDIHIEDYINEKTDENGNTKPNLISAHILKKESIDKVDYIEFIHDRLVLAIAEHKEEEKRLESERIEREKIEQKLKEEQQLIIKRKKNIHRFYGILGAISIVILIGWLLTYFTTKPIVYHYEDIKAGETIPIHSKLYTIPNGKLILRNCSVLPYTFANNEKIQYVELDSVQFNNKSIPAADTLLMTEKQLAYCFVRYVRYYSKDFFQQFKTIIVEKPKSFEKYSDLGNAYNIDSIKHVQPITEDSAYFKVHRGTLFVLNKPDSLERKCIWYPLFTESTPIMIDDGFFGDDSIALKNPQTISLFDLAKNNDSILDNINKSNNNIRLKLCCSDANKDILFRNDIPIEIRRHFVEADLSQFKTIENNAFSNCTNLNTIELENAVFIGDSAFYGCNNLKELSLPSTKHLGKFAFYNCNNLTRLALPLLDTVQNYAFYACYKLTELYLPQATFIGSLAFNNCNTIESISLPNATYIGDYAFQYAKALTELYLPQTTTLGYASFGDCHQLKQISLPNVSTIGDYAFQYAKTATEVSIPNVTSIGYGSFNYSDSIQSVYAPRVKRIGQYAFARCTALKEITLDSVKIIDSYAFQNDTLDIARIPQVDSIGLYAFNINNPNTKVKYNSAAYIAAGNPIFINHNNESAQNDQESTKNTLGFIVEYLESIGYTPSEIVQKDNKINKGILPNPQDDPFYKNVNYSIVENGDNCFIFKRTSDSERPYMFYYLRCDSLTKLEIDGKYNHSFNYYPKRVPIIDTIIMHHIAPHCFLYHGDMIFLSRIGSLTLAARTNREKYVSVHPRIQQGVPSYGSKCKAYIALYHTEEIDNFPTDKAQDITLIVPYGQLEYYQANYGTKFSKIEQLNVLQTIGYRAVYGVLTYPNTLKLIESIIHSDYGDIISFFSFLLFAIAIIIVLNRSKVRIYNKRFWLCFIIDILVSAAIYAIGGLIVFYSHANEPHFSMWPSWIYAVPLLVVYLAITGWHAKRNAMKDKPSNKNPENDS